MLGNKGQGTMALITLAVAIMIGVYLTGSIYNAATTSVTHAGVSNAINTTLNNSVTGFTLLAVAIIVGAAVFILSMMGGRR